MTVASSPLVINGVGFTAIPGLSVTFTPHVDTRLVISVRACVKLAAAPGSGLFIRLLLNGAGVSQRAFTLIQTVGEVDTVSMTFAESLSGVLLKDTTYTVAVDAALDVAGSTYHILNTANQSLTVLGPVIALPHLHS